LPVTGETFGVKPEIRGPAADPFPGLRSLVHDAGSEHGAEGIQSLAAAAAQ